jgi:hypothetical protein
VGKNSKFANSFTRLQRATLHAPASRPI